MSAEWSRRASPPILQRATLRRADWRFLLPTPSGGRFAHLVLLGGEAGLAARLVEEGLAARVDCAMTDTITADAMVALHDADIDPDEFTRHLPANCPLYIEVDRRRPGRRWLTPARLCARLQAGGATIIGVYWAKPHFDACEMLLPLEARRALAWYLETLYVPRSAGRRLLGVLLRTLSRVGTPAFGPFAPCYAVAALGEPGVALRGAATPLGIPITASGRPGAHSLLITSADDERSRVVVLPFAGRGARPALTLKAARRVAQRGHTEGEQLALTAIHAVLDAPLRTTIPQPLALLHRGGELVAAQGIAAGRCFSAVSGRWAGLPGPKRDGLRRVADWLADFHEQTQIARPIWDREQASRWIAAPLDAYVGTFGFHHGEARLFAAARARAADLLGLRLPIVWQHHDLHESNVYLTGPDAGYGVTVIDWERARHGPALADLLYFVKYWYYTVRGLRGEAAQLHGFRQLYLDATPGERWGATGRAAIGRYLARLDIAPAFLPLLLTVSCAEHALDWAERQREVVGAIPDGDPRAGNRWSAYLALLAADPGRVFSPFPAARAVGR